MTTLRNQRESFYVRAFLEKEQGVQVSLEEVEKMVEKCEKVV